MHASSPKSPETSSRLRWRAAVIRFAIAITFFVAAAGTLIGLVSHVSPALVTPILTVFLGYPLVVQALVVVVVLTVVGLLAAVKQIQQAIQAGQSQENVRIGTEAAIEGTVTQPLRAMQRLGERITELLERLVGAVSPPRADPQGAPKPAVERPTEEPSQPHETVRPLPSAIFIGREAELDWLVERLNAHGPGGDITVVYGMSGIGKSALVDKAIERAEQGRFTGAVARVHCRDIGDHLAVLRSTLERVNPNRRLPLDLGLDVLRQISEQLLSDKERLIVLDGVEPGVQLDAVVYALRTSTHSAHLLITTTSAPSAEVAPKERQLHLEALGTVVTKDGAEDDLALKLFAQYAGKASAAEFGAALPYARAIVDALERHTYALQLMGAYVQLQPNMLEAIANEVRTTLLSGMVTAGLEGVLGPVWLALTATLDDLGKRNPESLRLLFAVVTALNSVNVGRLATRALGDALGLRDKDRAIVDLLRRELAVSFDDAEMPRGSDRHRLRIHTLLLGYVNRASQKPEWAETVRLSRDAAASFYAGYLRRYDHRDAKRDNQRILGIDEDCIMRSLDWAMSNDQHENTVAIAHGLRRFWLDGWRNDLTEQYMPRARDAAMSLAERARQERNTSEEQRLNGLAADLSFTLGRMYRRTGRLPEAEPLFLVDLAYRKQHKQYAEQAEAYHQLAQLERSRGRMRDGLRYCRRGLAVVKRHLPRHSHTPTQDEIALIQAKGLLIAQWGRIERSRGNLLLADKLFAEAYELFHRSGDVLEQGVALGYRGRVARVLGNLRRAADFFEQSTALAQRAHDTRGQGSVATQFGRIARTRGDIASAKRDFEDGLRYAQQVLDKTAVAVNLNYLGRIAHAQGNAEEAKEYFTKSFDIAKDIGDRQEMGVALDYLGRVSKQEGELAEARRNFVESLAILRAVEDRRGQALVLAQMALLDIDEGHYVWARLRLWKSLRIIGKVGDRRSEGTIVLFHGQLDFARGKLRAARARFEQALIRAQELGDAGGEADARAWIGKIGMTRTDDA